MSHKRLEQAIALIKQGKVEIGGNILVNLLKQDTQQ